jgi:endo-1,4-beta-mannosidase
LQQSELFGNNFVLGINYWPRRKAMGWWGDFDAGEVEEEFSLINELGLKLVRIFLLWEDWQPEIGRINQAALNNLERLCGIAEHLDLTLDVTFFTGHMSGSNWAPGWMLRPDQPMPAGVNQVVSGGKVVNCGYANLFEDPTTQEAGLLLLQTVVRYFKDHPAIGLWNLGNEPDLFALPRNARSGRQWVRRFTTAIREIDQVHPVTCGLHVPSLTTDNGLRVNEVFREVDLAVIHGYPMYADWAKGPLDADFVPFLCALVSALCGKPTLAEEFGGPTEAPGRPSTTWEWNAYGRPRRQFVASEEEFAIFIEQSLLKLAETGALGAVLWCFADYIPALYDRPPCDEARHERFFGMVRPDGSLKPHAQVIQRFARQRPVVQPGRRGVNLDVSPEDYYQNPLYQIQRLYKAYRANSITL